MKKVLSLYYKHQNGVLRSCSQTFGDSLAALEHETIYIDLAEKDDVAKLNMMLSRGEIDFCFGIQGVGSTITTNGKDILWTAYRTPFIGIHYDSPCHNPFNHFSESSFVANLYFFESFLDMKQRYLPSNQISVVVPFKLPMQWVTLIYNVGDFALRPIHLLYLKNGAPLAEHDAYIDSLPPKIRDGIRQQLERARKDPNLQLCDLVDEIFTSAGMDRHRQERQFWGVVQTMDIYLRSQRAINLVNWLKFQDGAVIIGDGWDFIDKAGARATFKQGISTVEADHYYLQSRFFFNTNPYGRDIIHERVVMGLFSGCCVLSDTNAWWDKNFGHMAALTRFNWSSPLDDQLQPALNDPQAATYTQTSITTAFKTFVEGASAQPLIDLSRQVRDFAAKRV